MPFCVRRAPNFAFTRSFPLNLFSNGCDFPEQRPVAVSQLLIEGGEAGEIHELQRLQFVQPFSPPRPVLRLCRLLLGALALSRSHLWSLEVISYANMLKVHKIILEGKRRIEKNALSMRAQLHSWARKGLLT